MILYLDLRNDTYAFAAIEAKKATWVTASGGTSAAGPLAKAFKEFGLLKKKPTCVALAIGGDAAKRNVSWSTVRAGVATANALALAWNVPVARIHVEGDETHGAIETLVRKAAKAAKPGEWASAVYSGEPTITKAKSVL